MLSPCPSLHHTLTGTSPFTSVWFATKYALIAKSSGISSILTLFIIVVSAALRNKKPAAIFNFIDQPVLGIDSAAEVSLKIPF